MEEELELKLFNATIQYLNQCYKRSVEVLTYLSTMFHFFIPWEHQKTSGFFMFSGVVEM